MTASDAAITTVTALESAVGTRPAAIDQKVIDHLDVHAQRWLRASPLAFVGVAGPQMLSITAAGGRPGFAVADDPTHLRVACADLDDPALAVPGRGVGALFLLPGLRETLRVNGTITEVAAGACVIAVDECFAHCAKALIRSEFWNAPAAVDVFPDEAGFLRACRFMALATADGGAHIDVSPRGDPAGLLVQPIAGGLRFADRPGNRRTDSLRNVLAQPRVAALLVVPGHAQVMRVEGTATLDASAALAAPFEVNGKVPRLVASIGASSLALQHSAALARAAPWARPAVAPADIDPAAIFAAHVGLNRARGLSASLTRGMVKIPGLMRRGLAHDYKNNLY